MSIHDIAETYVRRYAELDPIGATLRGIPGHDAEMTDFSPDAIDARAELDRQTLASLKGLPPNGASERIAADVMRERLEAALAVDDAGEPLRALRITGSPVQMVRQCFDLMLGETADDWEVIAARLERVPASLKSIRAMLLAGLQRNLKAAQRQALACAEQATTWSGLRAGTLPFFVSLVGKYDGVQAADGTLRRRLDAAAGKATQAYAEMARFLREDYAPRAAQRDAAGPERYRLMARTFTGMDLDLQDTYAWGWDELHRIEEEMRRVAARILPGEPLSAVVQRLESDPGRAIEGVDRFRQWLQDLMDRTISELDGVHFDISEPVRRVEAMIAPPGGAAAMYYTRPSEDFRRPGRTWYPTRGRTRFPLWGEVSTAYHEGVPGHHLQLAQMMCLGTQLTRFQRTFAFIPGHSEGWALYAERLMGELGYLDNPDYELGMLAAQGFRAMRVVVDIGLHLELPIPGGERYHPGERWTPELALPFLVKHGRHSEDFAQSELDRYLGWPGQAICYKVGERVWLHVRDEARRRAEAAFDLKNFHTRALNLGPMGLAQLQRELRSSP